MTTGAAIRIMRSWRGISQEQLADAIGAKQARVSLFERERLAPTTAEAEAIDRAFGVTGVLTSPDIAAALSDVIGS